MHDPQNIPAPPAVIKAMCIKKDFGFRIWDFGFTSFANVRRRESLVSMPVSGMNDRKAKKSGAEK
jgi:hypothetical protein